MIELNMSFSNITFETCNFVFRNFVLIHLFPLLLLFSKIFHVWPIYPLSLMELFYPQCWCWFNTCTTHPCTVCYIVVHCPPPILCFKHVKFMFINCYCSQYPKCVQSSDNVCSITIYYWKPWNLHTFLDTMLIGLCLVVVLSFWYISTLFVLSWYINCSSLSVV